MLYIRVLPTNPPNASHITWLWDVRVSFVYQRPSLQCIATAQGTEILILPFAFDVAMQSVVQRSCYLRYLLFQSQETRGANGIKNESFAPCIPQFFLPEVLGFKIKEVRLSLKESVQQRLASIPQG